MAAIVDVQGFERKMDQVTEELDEFCRVEPSTGEWQRIENIAYRFQEDIWRLKYPATARALALEQSEEASTDRQLTRPDLSVTRQVEAADRTYLQAHVNCNIALARKLSQDNNVSRANENLEVENRLREEQNSGQSSMRRCTEDDFVPIQNTVDPILVEEPAAAPHTDEPASPLPAGGE
jgi:hypothetical protein